MSTEEKVNQIVLVVGKRELASSLGMTRPTLNSRIKDGSTWTVGEVEKIDNKYNQVKAMFP